MADFEVTAGTPVKITMTFTNEITKALANPSSATLGIQVGIKAPTLVDLADFTHVSTGVYYYVFDTTNAPGEYVAQVQSTGTIASISDENQGMFTVLPPAITGLT